MWTEIVFASVAALFTAHTISALICLRSLHRLPPAAAEGEDSRAPFVSIVIAARDEADRIEATIQHALAQSGIELEVIVVDDRSTDATPEVLQRLARQDARVRIHRVDTLPPDWLGKCHACHVGAGMAQGEWILFTDADCWLSDHAVIRAITVAGQEIHHVTLTPGIVPESLAGAGWHLLFLMSIGKWMDRVNRDQPGAYVGIGAFNLIRREAYFESGGHEALRLTVIDDVRLGLLLNSIGKRTRAFLGAGDALCHWGTTASSMFRIMEKNYFAAVSYRTPAALSMSLAGICIWLVAMGGMLSGTAIGPAATAALFSVILPAVLYARRLDWPAYQAIMTPLVYPLLFSAMLNSALVTLRQGGIRWRDTFYPLRLLRERGR